ncbi:MAG: DUF1573 domain-containing protein [Bacteroidetes bacterium]|jgi:hypothetical protein|nr:DUF1573 domain-containing protein [Bacteroidota bacterium]
MKKLAFLLFFSTIALSSFAQNAAPAAQPKSSAVMKFKSEAHDFGTITEGDKATHAFEFTNTGSETLIISNVSASCGCTTPEWTREPVKPGEKGTIKAVYNSAGRPGMFTKQVTVTSNAGTGTQVLTIKGNVVKADENVPENKGAASPVTKPN